MRSITPARSTVPTLIALIVLLTAGLPVTPLAAHDATTDEQSAAPVTAGMTVDKRNDADGDGVFSDVEEVRGSGAAVTFHIVVTNTSPVLLTVTTVTDTVGGTTLDLLDPEHCPQLETVIGPEQEATCTFTLGAYLRTYDAPPRDGLTNTVRVVATHDDGEVVAEDTSTVSNPGARKVSVEVEKTNDADGDGSFSDEEFAATPGQDVPFEVVVRNTSPGTAAIQSLTDTWPGLDEPVDLLRHCPELAGMHLRGVGGGGHDDARDDGHDDEGDGCGGGGCDDDGHDDGHGGERVSSVRCTFSLPDYAPPAGTAVTNTVSVTLVKPHAPERIATATSTSTVTTPPTPPVDDPQDPGHPQDPGDPQDPERPVAPSVPGPSEDPASAAPSDDEPDVRGRTEAAPVEDVPATSQRGTDTAAMPDTGRLPSTGVHLLGLLLAAIIAGGVGGILADENGEVDLAP